VAARARFVRVSKDAESFESGPLDERPELCEVRIGLAGMAHDERASQREAWDELAQPLYDRTESATAVPAPHGAQHRIGTVLHGHVHVRHHPWVVCE